MLSARSRKGRMSALPCGAPVNTGPKSVAHPPPQVMMTFVSLSGIALAYLKPKNEHPADHMSLGVPELFLDIQHPFNLGMGEPGALTDVRDDDGGQSLDLLLDRITHGTHPKHS